MSARAFDSNVSPGQRRVIVRRDGGGVEMVELPWGLRPREPGGRPFTLVRAEGRSFPSHRCLVPASEVDHKGRGGPYAYAPLDGDWFYLAGIWQPAAKGWPEAFAILTIEANADLAPFHDRQMVVLRRDQRMAWLDPTCTEAELLRPLPAGSFRVSPASGAPMQAELALQPGMQIFELGVAHARDDHDLCGASLFVLFPLDRSFPPEADEPATAVKLTPAVPIKRLVTDDYMVCLQGEEAEDAEAPPDDCLRHDSRSISREVGLRLDYPMVATNYSTQRQALEKQPSPGSRPRRRQRRHRDRNVREAF